MSKSLWQKADELARKARSVSDVEAADTLEELAVVVRDLCERIGLRNEGIDHPLLEGVVYEVTLKIRCHVIDHDVEKNDAKNPDAVTNVAYELKLEDRNFLGGRTVSIDADEIVDVRMVV